MTKADARLITNSAITVTDLDTTVNSEPRVHDLRLAGALGFANRYDIRALIRRHLTVLKTFGEVSFTREKPGQRGGRPGTDYWLNEEQALFITAKSDTERAALVTVEMVRVFKAVRTGKPVKVQEHRCSKPTLRLPPPQPALPPPEVTARPFEPGSNLLKDLHSAVLSALARVKAGEAADFGQALYEVLDDHTAMAEGATPKGAVLDWNWKRAPMARGGRKR